jgi:hypothetical protein
MTTLPPKDILDLVDGGLHRHDHNRINSNIILKKVNGDFRV